MNTKQSNEVRVGMKPNNMWCVWVNGELKHEFWRKCDAEKFASFYK